MTIILYLQFLYHVLFYIIFMIDTFIYYSYKLLYMYIFYKKYIIDK